MSKFWLFCLILISSVKTANAVSVNILNSPKTTGEDKIVITVQIAGADPATNYLRADLYKEGTTLYFGETDNGQYWYDGAGSIGKQFYPVEIIKLLPSPSPDSSPGASPSPINTYTLYARIGSPTPLEYPGPGSYKLRIRRYTAAGKEASNDDTTPVDIELTKIWPSPSPSPTPTSTPTPSPSPSPSPTITPTPTPKPSPSPLPSPSQESISEATVAGVSTDIDLSAYGSSPSPTLKGKALQTPTLNHSRLKTVIYIGVGLIILSVASFFGYRRYLGTIAK